MPEWLYAIEDNCLREVARAMLDARSWAIDRHADKHKIAVKTFEVAKKKLAIVQEGRGTSAELCKAAALALRKYNTAGEQALSTAETVR